MMGLAWPLGLGFVEVAELDLRATLFTDILLSVMPATGGSAWIFHRDGQ